MNFPSIGRQSLISISIQFALIAAAFLAFFDPSILNPKNVGWISEGDLRQHYLGWTAFRQTESIGDLWGNSPLLAYPYGAPLAATDSNPLVSLFLWPFSDILPEDFQFIGPWYLLSLTLSFALARSLFKHAGFDKTTASLAGAFLAFQPILFWRYGHDTLTAHWLIIAALHVSFVTKIFPLAVFKHALLLLLSIMIHPYLFIMLNFVVSFDLLHRAYRQLGPRFGVIELTLFCFFAAQATAVYVGIRLGIFSLKTLSSNQIGVFSTDFLSIFNPFGSSRFVPQISAGDGQYEGYAYLGLGTVILFAYIIYLISKKHSEPVPFHRLFPLAIAAMVAFLFALSPTVTVLGAPIFELELAETSPIRTIFEKLRSSGRFVWVSIYIGIFALLLALPRANRKSTKIVLSLALFIQFIDLAPLRSRTLEDTKFREVPEHQLTSPEWTQKIRRADYIYLSRPLGLEFSLDVGAAAFPLNTPISFFYTAQGLGLPKQQAAEEQLRVQVLSGNFEQSALVFLDEGFELPVLHRNASGILVSRDYDEFHVIETEAFLGNAPMRQTDYGLSDLLKICVDKCTAALVSQGDAFTFLSDETKQFLTNKGSKISNANNGFGYVALLRNGTLFAEEIAQEEALLNALVSEHSFSLRASTKQDIPSSLSIEGVDLARNQSGINLAMMWDDGRMLTAAYNTSEITDSLIQDAELKNDGATSANDTSLEPAQDLTIEKTATLIELEGMIPVSSAEPFIGLHRYLSEESSLLDVLTDCRQACTMAISVKDEGAASFPRAARRKAAQIGLTLSELEFRDGYSAIVENGIVLAQGRSFQEVVDLAEVVGGIRIRVQSAGFEAGNLSSIKFDNEEHSMAQRGVNIVVLMGGEKVITYHFDTHGTK